MVLPAIDCKHPSCGQSAASMTTADDRQHLYIRLLLVPVSEPMLGLVKIRSHPSVEGVPLRPRLFINEGTLIAARLEKKMPVCDSKICRSFHSVAGESRKIQNVATLFVALFQHLRYCVQP